MNKQFLILLSGRVLHALLAIASIRLMTSLLDKENVGNNYLILSITSWFSLILINPMGVYLNRHIMEWLKHGFLRRRFLQLTGYFFLVSAASIPLVVLASEAGGIGRSIGITSLVSTVAIYVFGSTWALTLYTSLNMLEHRSAFVSLSLLAQVVGIAVATFLVVKVSATASCWLLGILTGHLVAGLLAWLYYKSRIFTQTPETIAMPSLFQGDLAKFCIPIAVTTIFMWTQNQSYRLIVESVLGVEFLATLAVGLGVAASLSGAIESLVTQYFYPSYYAATSNRDPDVRVKAWNCFFLRAVSIFIPSMLFCFGCSKYLIFFLVAQRFHDTYPVLMWGIAIELARMFANVAHVVSHSEKNTRTTIMPYVMGAVSMLILLTFALGVQIGDRKDTLILAALFVAGTVTCFTMFVSVRKILNVHVDIRFTLRALAFSLPLCIGLWFGRFELKAPTIMLLCASLGLYALFVIWTLQKRIMEKMPSAAIALGQGAAS